MEWRDPTTHEDEIEASLEFRPTLVIGLGGTGHEVLVRLKARFLDTFGEDAFKAIKLLVFDTADESLAVSTESGRLVSLLRDTELINIGHIPVERLIRNLDKHPAIKAWLPEKLPPRAITAGAKQIRPLGRLALFYHYNQDAKIQDRLTAVIRALANIKLKGASAGEGAIVANTRGVNVFVVCSLCGGTGSGTFLDMAYLTRQILQNHGIRPEYCYINGVLVLPQAFAMVASDAIMANAYAALMELNYYTREGGFHVTYPDGMTVDAHARPFNICYLVDAVNEHGRMLTGLEDLAPMIAESIFLQTGSQVGQATKSVFDNVKSLDQMDNDEPTAFSGLGTASLVFPAQRIINTCAYRFGRQFIREGLLKNVAQDQDTDQIAKQFIEKMKMTPKSLMPELGRDAKGRIILIRLEATELGKVKDDQIIQEVDRFLQIYEVRRLNGEYKKFTDANMKHLQEKVISALQQETVRLVDDPAFGSYFAVGFLDNLARRLNALIGGFGRQRQKLNARLEQEKRATNALRDALSNAARSFIIGRGGRVSKAREKFIEAKQSEFAALFEIRKLTLAIALLSHLNTAVSEQRKKTTALIDKFNALEKRFEREARSLEAESGQMRFVLSTDISDLRDIDRYYEQYKRPVTQELSRFLERCKNKSLYSLTNQDEDTIGRFVFDFAREIFQPIEEERLEKIIQEKRERIPPESRLEDLRDDSVPFWNYDSTRMSRSGNIESIRVIGVEDKDTSYFRDMIRKGDTLASTRDPHQLTILHSKHGIPIFALEQIEMYRTKYEEHNRQQVSPLHLFRNLPWLRDNQIARQWFALGQAFGFIHKLGVWYYCKPIDELDEEKRLAQGLEASLNTFVNDPDLIQEMADMVEQEILRIGNEKTTEILTQYLKLPRSKDRDVAKLEENLQKQVRKFMQEMR